ncbi:Uncharacterized protein Adt_28782 [Abeliophyllum distichum]|uniref:Uncharacterized protein n=1 Tax=Abeliophyllum distichum TaxID=126358 RepID=A0ABD1RYW0_9LAMI
MASSGNHETSTNAMSPSPWLTDDQKMVLESKSDALDNGGWNHGGERRRPGGEEEGSLLQEGGGEEGSLHGILLAAEDGDGENGVVNGGRRHGGKRRWPSSEEEESHLQEGVGESGSHDGAEEGILQQGSSGGLLAAAEGGEGGSGGLTWSVATCIGRRNYMEDVVTILPDFMSIPCAKFGGCLSPELHAEKAFSSLLLCCF